MANLSNINNKFIVDDGGNVLVGSTANLSTYTGISLYGANPSLAIKTSSGSGWIWTQYVNSSGTNNFSMGVNQSVPYWGVKVGAGMDTPHLAVDASGNVGISTIAPSSPTSVGTFLEIRGRNGVAGGTAGIVLKDYDNDAWDIWSSGGGLYSRYNNTVEGWSITLGGNVGIGATGASRKLDVRDTSNTQATILAYNQGASFTGTVYEAITDRVANSAFNLMNLKSSTASKFLVRGDGNVGIGTTSPGAKLQIGSATYAPNSNLSNNLLQIKSPSGFAYLTIGNGDSADSTSYIGGASGFIVLGSVTDAGAASEHIRMTNTGNVGIGTTSPTGGKLQIEGADDTSLLHLSLSGGYSKGSLEIDDPYFVVKSTSNTTGGIKFRTITGGTIYDRMTILNSGNVGIGTTSPYGKLDVQTGGSTRLISLNYQDSLNTIMSHAGAPNYGLETLTIRGDVIRFYTDYDVSHYQGVEQMRIDSAGNVGIGNTSPSDFNSLGGLQVVIGDGTGTTNLTLYSVEPGGYGHVAFADSNVSSSSAQYAGLIQYYHANNDMRFYTNAAEKMRITSAGNVGIGTTLPTTALTIRKAISPTAYGGEASMIEFKSYYTGYDTETVKSAIYSGVSDLTGLQTARGFMSFWTSSYIAAGTENLTEKMRIESNGNVGIGTTSPVCILNIEDSVASTAPNTDANNLLLIENTNVGGSCNIRLRGGDGATRIMYGHNVTGEDKLYITPRANDTNHVIFDGSGNVNISNGTPELKLTDTSSSATFKMVLNGVNTDITNSGTNGDITFHTHNGEKFRMNEDYSYFSNCDVGIGTTSPSAKLDVADTVFVGDSTTGTTIRRKNQLFATMKPGPSSGGSIDMIFVDHTHSLNITVVAYINGSNVATGRGYSVVAYGGGTAGLTQTSFAGVISALSISYVNTGGSENYILRVTTTYTGVTAPIISVTAQGQSPSKLRAAV